jgi:hypothetical protein
MDEKEDCFFTVRKWLQKLPAEYADSKKQQRFLDLNFNSIRQLVRPKDKRVF